MNVEDSVKINKILNLTEPLTPGIKIMTLKRRSSVVEEFKRDLKLFKSCGGYRDVARILIYGECFFKIQLKDNATPFIYYFASCFGEVASKLDEIRQICADSGIPVDEFDDKLIFE